MTDKTTTKKSSPVKVNLGCGVGLFKGFINVDKYFTLKQLQSKRGLYRNAMIEPGAEFVQADAANLPFSDSSVDYIESINMIEHIPIRDVPQVFAEIARILKPGGRLGLLTDNFDKLAQNWTNNVAKPDFSEHHYFELAQLIYGNQLGPGEFHTSPFNPWILNSFIVWAGLTLDKMTIYPQGSTDAPQLQTVKWQKNSLLRNEVMWAEAHLPK